MLWSQHGTLPLTSGYLAIWCRKKARTEDWDNVEATPAVSRWDATPGRPDEVGATPGRWDATPGGASRWDATPTPGRVADGVTPRKNRWDDATPTPGRVRAVNAHALSHFFVNGIFACIVWRRMVLLVMYA